MIEILNEGTNSNEIIGVQRVIYEIYLVNYWNDYARSYTYFLINHWIASTIFYPSYLGRQR